MDNVSVTYVTYTHSTSCSSNPADMYAWGHNGQYKDNELYGKGTAYTAEYWEYDARLLRRWNTDPIEYEWQSTYACFNNNPIFFADPLGLEGTNGDTDPPPGTDENCEGRPDSDHAPVAKKQEDGTIKLYSNGDITSGSWELEGVKITPETSKVAEYNYGFTTEGMRESHWKQAKGYAGEIFTTEDGLSHFLNHSILALFGGQSEIKRIENKVVAGGEVYAKVIVDYHPGVGIYNLQSYYLGNGNDIYGEEQSFLSANLNLLNFAPGINMADDALKPVIRVVNSADDVYDAAKGGLQYTKSSLQLGQQMHKTYRVGQEGIKEFRLLSGKRIDFLDIKNGIIYELKPFNPRAMKQGQRQLQMYLKELQSPAMLQKYPELRGINWKTVLETY